MIRDTSIKSLMEKAYIIQDKERVILGIAKTTSRSKAIYQTFESWGEILGLDFIEFCKIINCWRVKYLDDINFSYFDGNDFSEEYEELSPEIIKKEVMEANSYYN